MEMLQNMRNMFRKAIFHNLILNNGYTELFRNDYDDKKLNQTDTMSKCARYTY